MGNSCHSSSSGLVGLFPCSTDSPDDTQDLGKRVAGYASPGDVFALVGPVGSGKTQFVKGICSALGVEERNVTSPTFAIAHEYEGDFSIVHLDLYRLESEDDAINIGFEDYLSSRVLALVEWPEIAVALLPANTLIFSFEHLEGEKRRIQILNPDIIPTTDAKTDDSCDVRRS